MGLSRVAVSGVGGVMPHRNAVFFARSGVTQRDDRHADGRRSLLVQ
jgi:hypothetical protein